MNTWVGYNIIIKPVCMKCLIKAEGFPIILQVSNFYVTATPTGRHLQLQHVKN